MEGKNSFSKHLQDADVLPLEITYIPECVLVKSDQELNLSQEERNSRLLELIKLLEGNKVSKGIVFQQDFLHRYLIHSRYDVNRAFSRVRNYLSLNKHHNYFFQSIKYDFTAHHSCKFITMLPHRCSDGTITLLYEMGNSNKTEVVPVIYRRYHLINGNAAMNTLLTLIKPFMPSFMKKILTIHSSPEELLKYYPRSMLPTKYGGSLSEYYMADRLKKINEEHDNYIVEGQRNTF
ncbi:hypothetical protein HNY73_015176 [Argiope bruennichi]|uniref:CRAL-TRIO domain-containing protein n=1 Tax=Argiope bruennichi TaxID=94029 RepID=A0A8T0ET72_ARGBR|nr:hypothetical protein HNY73_015176 [Argiope bruennichi]